MLKTYKDFSRDEILEALELVAPAGFATSGRTKPSMWEILKVFEKHDLMYTLDHLTTQHKEVIP